MRDSRISPLALVVLFAASHSATHGQPPTQPPDDAIVAMLDGEPIRYVEVKRQMAAALQGRTIPPEALPVVQAQSLEQVLTRKLILADLRRRRMQPTAEELKQADENFAANLARSGQTREEYLAKNGFTAAELEEFRYWDICWNRFSAERLTDAELQKFFDARRRDYDGTQLRVSHILLRIEGKQDQATPQAAAAKASRIRQDVIDKKLTFAEAAAKYSAGPSREHGGDLGFIPRHERMAEEFSSAAFRLQPGEISPPVATPFGIHLITVTDVKPGDHTLGDVREQVLNDARVALFRTIGSELRKTARIEYADVIAHLDPTSGQIVPAKNP